MPAASTEQREWLKERIYAIWKGSPKLPTLVGPSLDGEGRQVRLPIIDILVEADLVDLAREAYLVGRAQGVVAETEHLAVDPAVHQPLASYTARVTRRLDGRQVVYQFTAPSIESAVKGLRAITPWPWDLTADPLADDEEGKRP